MQFKETQFFMYIKDLEKQHMNAFKTLLITNNNNKYDSIIVCNILLTNYTQFEVHKKRSSNQSDKTPAVTKWGTHSADKIAH